DYNLSNHLDSVIAAIDGVQYIIAKDGTNRPTGSKLGMAVLKHLNPKLADMLPNFAKKPIDGKLDDLLNGYLKEYDASLDHISAILVDLKNQAMHARTNLDAGREFQQEVRDLYLSHDAALVAMMGQLQQDITKYCNSFKPEDNPFHDL